MSELLLSLEARLGGVKRWLLIDATAADEQAIVDAAPGDGVLLLVGLDPAAWPSEDDQRRLASRPLVVCIDHSEVNGVILAEHPAYGVVPAAGVDAVVGAPQICVHREGYPELFAKQLSNVVTALRPDAILGVDWSGQSRSAVCRCNECAEAFEAAAETELPVDLGPDDVTARWLAWRRGRVTELWRALDGAVRALRPGGATAWIGMLPCDHEQQSERHIDIRGVALLSPIRFIDVTDFSGPGRASRTRESVRRIVGTGFGPVVGIIAPSVFGANDGLTEAVELSTCAALLALNGAAVAVTPGDWKVIDDAVSGPGRGVPYSLTAVVWSTENRERYGADWAQLLVDKPYEGMVSALSRMNTSFRSVPIEDLPRHLNEVRLVVLPNLAILTDADAAVVRDFVRSGGSLLATGETGRFDEDNAPRTANVLSDVLGVKFSSPADRLAPITARVMHGFQPLPALGRLKGPATEHSYLRLHPELARKTAGPHVDREPHVTGERHEILSGFEDTDLIAFGGRIPDMTVDGDRETVMTLVPGFRSSPIEKVVPSPERTQVPGLIAGTFGHGRVVYLPADIDRRYGVDPIPDHLALLRNVIRWLGGDSIQVTGHGAVATEIHDTAGGRRAHLLNLTGFDGRGGQRRHLAPATEITLTMPASTSGGRSQTHRIERLEHYKIMSVD